MKSTGMVRQVDTLGRVVLPVELRRTLGIDVKDPVEIFVEGDNIILRKYQVSCVFCGGTDDLQMYNGKAICPDCLLDLAQRIEEA
jgi:transcriptional pleiotropic regulator of transition state genes